MRRGKPKNGTHGGLALWRVSLYSAKFFVLAINFLINSRVSLVLPLTCCHVRCRRWIGAVPRAEMMEVRVEKLFSSRHFYQCQIMPKRKLKTELTSATETKCLMTMTLLLTSAWFRII